MSLLGRLKAKLSPPSRRQRYNGGKWGDEGDLGWYQAHPAIPQRHTTAWPLRLLSGKATLRVSGVTSLLVIVYLTLKSDELASGDASSSTSWRRVGPNDFGSPRSTVAHPYPQLSNLIMVAGHSVFIGSDFTDARSESNWYLEPYQQVPGQAESFVRHIQLGVEMAATDPKALLLFSGGPTRFAAGPRSEAASYWGVADALLWFGFSEVKGRSALEEAARDSYENIAFSLCRFHQLTGRYPDSYTVVSYDFKRWRFTELHRSAVLFPAEHFYFIGTPALSPDQALEGEARTVEKFKQDPHGCREELLAKKVARNPFAVYPPYSGRGVCPELQGLLHRCGSRTLPLHL